MAEWIETAVRSLTNRYEYLYRWILSLDAKIKALQQGLMAAQQQDGGQGQSQIGAFWCSPSAGFSSSLAGQTVFQTVTGVDTALPGTYTIYCKYGSPFVATNVLTVQPDGGGGFLGIAQSCT